MSYLLGQSQKHKQKSIYFTYVHTSLLGTRDAVTYCILSLNDSHFSHLERPKANLELIVHPLS